MDLKNINNVFFVGVGGIGMSALARYFKFLGKNVAGYDRTRTELTDALVAEGIPVSHCPDSECITREFRKPEHTLVVYTPAVPLSTPVMEWFKERNYKILKRAEVLGLLTREQKGICVAGTHGKTTVSTMISHLLKNSSVDCNAFLGGISLNYSTNLLVSEKSDYVVIEADEYDRSFHQLRPEVAVITSVDPDHLEIYGTYENVKEGFCKFASLVKKGGILLMKKGLPLNPDLRPGVRQFSYNISGPADFYAEKIRIEKGQYVFDLVTPDRNITELTLGVPGRVNLENAVVSLSVACLLGCSDAELKNGIHTFRGNKRRFEYHYKSDRRCYIDDYAHHPNEIKATLESIRELYPSTRLTGIFQPHLYSRTKDFAAEFAQSLSLLDELILLDIYPAREEPVPGVTSELIFSQVKADRKILVSKENLVKEIEESKPELLVSMGAGDIGEMVSEIKNVMKRLDA
ncbi:UDP-N-acetylmuramate--L-alanine ligase [Saccharicrinis sp. FJH62]|uniref:UDP-N-acetylmuramate--L-alanine ligase n=1 Tax=Saccharicrinis sp. FJH62 TaxID=3344657 RepID=UPI0035D46B5D